MQKLLIADASEPFTDALNEIFGSMFDLRLCHDGDTALELLQSFQPDILVFNFMLPFKDGLTALQQSAHRPAVILGVTPFISPYSQQRAASLGVQYIMITPTVHAVRVRLMDMISTISGEPPSPADQVALYLHILNFQPHLDGYRQLQIGIPLFAEDPGARLSKELYPAIAQQVGCKDGRSVEHSIRKAIESAWKRRNRLVWAKYFPPGPNGDIPCPTNKAFICRLAELLDKPIEY